MLGENAAALQTLQTAIAAREQFPAGGLEDRRAGVSAHTLEALALARLGRMAEARVLIAPQLAFERDLAGRNRGDATQCLELAQALYVASLTDPAHAAALRREALPPDRPPARPVPCAAQRHPLAHAGPADLSARTS